MDRFKVVLKSKKIEYYEDFDIAEVSTIKISAKVKFAIFPKTEKELERVIVSLTRFGLPFKVVGNISNVLFVEKFSYPIVVTSKMKDEYVVDGNLITVSAGMQLSKFMEILKRNKLGGAEGLFGIPATVGGAIVNNAGAFGSQISTNLLSVRVFHNGKIKTLNSNEIKFGYHYSNLNRLVLLSASFLFEKKNEYDIIKLYNEWTYKRTSTQPGGLSLGSVYQRVNGRSAGFYIERAGLKGLRVGGIVVSKKHSNFFINDKTGTYEDFLSLQQRVEWEVERQFGLSLICEIEKVGDNDEITRRPPHTF
ncbi:MAG: UDP-N-acetylmuramate dehydrogenase [Clostridia bacterium]|nr:UDP-N-acetylmuramate dehydrogenase [Clostridia bacterium]